MGIQRTMTAALAGLLTSGLVGACTDDSPDGDETKDGSKTTVDLTEIKGTEVLRPEERIIGDWDVAVSGKRSAIIAKITGSDGRPTRLKSVNPTSGTQTDLDFTPPERFDVAANDTTAVVAGDRTKDGRSELVVRTSDDLKSWDEVALSYPGRGWKFAAVGLDGDEPVVIAQEPDGSTSALRLDGDETTEHELPDLTRQAARSVDVVKHRGDLVYLGDDAKDVTRVLTSSDGGASWKQTARLPGGKESYDATGAVSTGEHIVATGSAEQKAPKGTTGMVWSSTNASTWTRDRVSVTEAGYSEADLTLSAPTVVDGRAAFDLTCDACDWTQRHVHEGSSDTQPRDSQGPVDAKSPQSLALPGPTSAGVRWEQGSLVTYSKGHHKTLLKGNHTRELMDVHRFDATTHAAVETFRFTRDPSGKGWTTASTLTPHVVDGTLQRRQWRPKVLQELGEIHSAKSPSGTTVVAGTKKSKDGFSATARAVSQGSWDKGTGLNRHEYEEVNGVYHADDDFLTSVDVANDASQAPRTARVYSSRDGTSWEEDPGDWSDAKVSSINDICALGDGRAIAVGSSQKDRNSAEVPTIWRRDKGRWAMTTFRDLGPEAATNSCATTGGTTVIDGQLDGRDTEWTTTDGTSLDPEEPLPLGTHRAEPYEVDGGLVAAGLLETKEHDGLVVWYSTDGKSWQWAPVDDADSASSITVRPAGDQVYVITGQDSGDRLWKINEIATKKVTADEA